MKSAVQTFLLALIPIAAVIPWAIVQMQVALNTNHAWLSIAAGRLLDGGRMTTDFYDPNPPLSILVYVPPVLLSRLSGIPVYETPYLFGFLYLGLSACAVWLLLKALADVRPDQRAVIFAAYLLAGTYLTSNFYFADRDELVIWGLFPFLLAQLCLTKEVRLSPFLKWPVLALGALAVLIKPHYGLLPVILMLHRAWRRKRLCPVALDADFLALTAAVLVYAAVILVCFSDYLTVILPQLPLYLAYSNANVPVWTVMCAIPILACALFVHLFELAEADRRPAYLCLTAAGLSLALYFIQMKGFYYHLIPMLVFAYCGFGLFLLGAARRYGGPSEIWPWVTVCLLAGAVMLSSPPQRHAITHEQYAGTKLAGLVKDCAPQCSYFIYGENMEMILQVSIYTGATWASRYPEPWWLKALINRTEDGPKNTEAARLLDRHTAMMVEDFNRYKPAVIAVLRNARFSEDDPKPFDFVAFFSRDAGFRDVMARYRKTGVLQDNRQVYFRNTGMDYPHPLTYDIYRRID